MALQTSPSKTKDYDYAPIIDDNMGLVVSVVNTFRPKDANQRDEFMQLGRIALWKAAQKYDASKAKFSTMAWNYIRYEILKSLRKESKESFERINDGISNSINKSHISEMFTSDMTDIECDIINLRNQGYTFKDIGEQIGYTSRWAYHIYQSAITKIRKHRDG